MEIMPIVASGIAFSYLYIFNKGWELGYISRCPEENQAGEVRRAQELREQGGFTNRMAARALESNYREHIRPETPLSRSLKDYWARLNNPENSIIDKLVLEVTEFPTFKGIYRSLKPVPANP